MLPDSTSHAMMTPQSSSSNTSARAPFTNPHALSKFRVRRSNRPFLATIRSLDLEVGSQGYPQCSCSSVTPNTRRAASHTSDAPLLMQVNHAKCLPFFGCYLHTIFGIGQHSVCWIPPQAKMPKGDRHETLTNDGSTRNAQNLRHVQMAS